tara:strand:+ start:282 stop:1091 length:810 start_codon:yes stop_codon:yes gene_type:complete
MNLLNKSNQISKDDNELKNLFNTNGFIVLRDSVPIDLIKEVKKDLLEAVDKNKITNSKRDIHFFKNGEISSAHNLIEYIPSYNKLMSTKKISNFFKSIFSEIKSSKFNSSYFAKPKYQGLETKPHQDNAFFCMEPAEIATCWMPLTFSNKNNGCLYYYEKSHNSGNLNHVPMGNLGASMCLDEEELQKVEKKFKKVFVELKLGDCIIHNALVVHGSEANKSDKDRNAFNFSLGNKNSSRNEVLFKNYKKKLENFLKKKKFDRVEENKFA